MDPIEKFLGSNMTHECTKYSFLKSISFAAHFLFCKIYLASLNAPTEIDAVQNTAQM